MTVAEFFEKHSDEYLRYHGDELIENVTHDLYVFNKLAQFVEKPKDLLVSATYGEIWFNVKPEDALKSLSELDMIRLIRCGLRYSEEDECFCMFV